MISITQVAYFVSMTAPANKLNLCFNAAAESAKLSNKESDWNLPGGILLTTRTWHGGAGRPDLSVNRRIMYV
jgi:hypothetical protein